VSLFTQKALIFCLLPSTHAYERTSFWIESALVVKRRSNK